MKFALVGCFMGKEVNRGALKSWLEADWPKVLGYTPYFHILVRGWICFDVRCE